MIFFTLGTYPLAFDRLLVAIDGLCDENIIKNEIFGQIGHTKYKPRNFEYVNILKKDDFDLKLKSATALISHAGMGTISMALENDKPLLVFPRLKEYKEVVNDHQLHTARKFEQLGHVLAAYKIEELSGQIEKLEYFHPKKRISQAEEVSERISIFIESIITKA